MIGSPRAESRCSNGCPWNWGLDRVHWGDAREKGGMAGPQHCWETPWAPGTEKWIPPPLDIAFSISIRLPLSKRRPGLRFPKLLLSTLEETKRLKMQYAARLDSSSVFTAFLSTIVLTGPSSVKNLQKPLLLHKDVCGWWRWGIIYQMLTFKVLHWWLV